MIFVKITKIRNTIHNAGKIYPKNLVYIQLKCKTYNNKSSTENTQCRDHYTNSS